MNMFNTEIPQYGWKAKFDHIFPQKRSQKLSATWSQILAMLPLFLRYVWYWTKKWFSGHKPVMNFICVEKNYQKSGVPLGGIGGGCVGRGFRGEFYNFHMLPGQYDPDEAKAMHFILNVQNSKKETIYQSVLTGGSKQRCGVLSTWEWNLPPENAVYTALYPRSWTEYVIPELNMTFICRQISPVIPHNYKDSCIPGGVFEWIIQNNSSEVRYVSITFTMNSSNGRHGGKACSEVFERSEASTHISGVMINESNAAGKYSYALAVFKEENVNITTCSYFNPNGNGSVIWNNLKKFGQLKNENVPNSAKDIAVAVCCRTLVNNEQTSMSFSLVWDMPVFKFTCAKRLMKRYYCKFFDDTGKAGPDMCLYSLIHYKKWELEIENWQRGVLESKIPDWYKSALFNELYYITNGGTIWVLMDDENDLPLDDPRVEYGRFAYLEGLEYRMYNTYDVHFYASFALTMLWPKLQISLQYDLRDTIDFEDTSRIWYLCNGVIGYRKTKGTVPHDFGDPDEYPYGLLNSYPIHDVANWRDLNLKFVLQVYRDYIIADAGNKYIHDMFNQMTSVMRRALQWDIDGDGMIENSGEADQTYDAWVMSGTSSYCGSLWLAALTVYIEMATIIKETSIVEEFSEIYDKAKIAFDKKLWTGKYYRFDSSGGSHSDSIMADQLCGLWYLRCSRLKTKVLPESKVKQALDTIYKYNVCAYYDGCQGAVNGMKPDFQIDRSSVQSEEMWIGVSYALASLLYSEGMESEAFQIAEGIYTTVYEKSGLGFATPEALHNLDSFRSLGYMRPLSIWSLQLAIEEKEN